MGICVSCGLGAGLHTVRCPCTVVAVCPCGTEIKGRPTVARQRNRKYCSRVCNGTYGGGKATKDSHCRRCGRAKDTENTYANGSCRRCTLVDANDDPNYVPPPRGQRPKASHCPRCGWAKDEENTYANGSCRRCTLADYNGIPDYEPLPRGQRPARPVKPKPASVKVAPVEPAWRPAGFSAVPNTRIPGRAS